MTADVEILDAGIVELLNEAESLAVLDQAANAITNVAASITRRGTSHRRHMADEYITENAKPGPLGGEAVAGNTSPFFHLEEFGSIHQPPQRMFFRAITQAGYQAEALPK